MANHLLDLALWPLRTARRLGARALMDVLDRRRHPIVLMHGFMGFARMGPLEYFVGVKEALELEGFRVHTPTVDPLNTFEYRAYEWVYGRPPGTDDVANAERVFRPRGRGYRVLDHRFRPHLADIYLHTRRPVHLVAHSQAAVDARYVASPDGLGSWRLFDDPTFDEELRDLTVADCIASVTTIGGPHNGVLVADDTELVTDFVQNVLLPDIDRVISLFSHDESALYRAAREFGRAYMLGEFNQRYADHDDVDYFSVAGITNEYQVTLFLKPFYELTRYNEKFEKDDNDGFVPVASAKWPVLSVDDITTGSEPSMHGFALDRPHQPERHGRWQFLGLVYADHVNQIGFPLSFPRNHIFHHLKFYAGLARHLTGEHPDGTRLRPDGAWGPSPTP
ncbi:MAG: hypothetical protein R3A49_02510 [Acidimicrobiia bacterium]